MSAIHSIHTLPLFLGSTAEDDYETLLTRWERDPSVEGDKRGAAKKIREAISTHSNCLDLSNLALTQMPPLGGLSAIKELNVTFNNFTSLPVEIGSLTALQVLKVSLNLLTSLPVEIGSLTALERLDASDNNLTSLPAEIGFLTGLQVLKVSTNLLTSLPVEIRSLTALQTLEASENKLTSLPVEIGSLTALKRLDVSVNELTSLPVEIRSLTELQTLEASVNKLTSLPVEIGSLNRLRSLNISHNELTNLPVEIGSLTELRTLYLHDNQNLEELPLTLGSISGLTTLGIDITNISRVVRQEILRRCQALRGERASVDLPERLRTWYIASRFDGEPVDITHFTEEEQKTVNEWLIRLERTRDFRGNPRALTSTVCQMLATTKTHLEFKEMFLAQVRVNNEACEDRAAMAINELYTGWKVLILPESASLQEKLHILVQGSKTLALRSAIADQISVYGRDQGESVEIYLFYETSLASRLDLLSLIQCTRYATTIGKREWINEAALVQAVEATYIEHLVELPVLQRLAEQDPDFQAVWAVKELAFSEQLEKLEQPNGSFQREGDILSEMKRVTKERTLAQKAFLKEWFFHLCSRYLRPTRPELY